MYMLSEDQETAYKKVKRMKAYKIAAWDDSLIKNYKQYFDYIWYKVLNEIDLYIEQEETPLTQQQALTAGKWLKENQYLTIEFKNMKI